MEVFLGVEPSLKEQHFFAFEELLKPFVVVVDFVLNIAVIGLVQGRQILFGQEVH